MTVVGWLTSMPLIQVSYWHLLYSYCCCYVIAKLNVHGHFLLVIWCWIGYQWTYRNQPVTVNQHTKLTSWMQLKQIYQCHCDQPFWEEYLWRVDHISVYVVLCCSRHWPAENCEEGNDDTLRYTDSEKFANSKVKVQLSTCCSKIAMTVGHVTSGVVGEAVFMPDALIDARCQNTEGSVKLQHYQCSLFHKLTTDTKHW